MTKVIVTIDNKSNTQRFLEMLGSLKYVKEVHTENEYDEQLSKEEIQMLEERWEDYLKNPGDVKTWKQVKKELLKKHGR